MVAARKEAMLAAEVSVNLLSTNLVSPRRSHGRTWYSRILKSSQAWMRVVSTFRAV
jgi:hypothetical protein